MKLKKKTKDILKRRASHRLSIPAIFDFYKSSFKIFLGKMAKKETTLFPESKCPLSFKNYYAYQGIVLFSITLLLFFTVSSFFIPKQKINPVSVIKTATTVHSPAIAGAKDAVQWTTIIKRSDIQSGDSAPHLLQLPKQAKNIRIKTISKQQANAIIALNNQQNTQTQLTLEDRQQLAKLSSQNQGIFARIKNAGYLIFVFLYLLISINILPAEIKPVIAAEYNRLESFRLFKQFAVPEIFLNEKNMPDLYCF